MTWIALLFSNPFPIPILLPRPYCVEVCPNPVTGTREGKGSVDLGYVFSPSGYGPNLTENVFYVRDIRIMSDRTIRCARATFLRFCSVCSDCIDRSGRNAVLLWGFGIVVEFSIPTAPTKHNHCKELNYVSPHRNRPPYQLKPAPLRLAEILESRARKREASF